MAIASAASAQFIADDIDVETAAGPIAILDSDDGFSRILQVGGQQFFTEGFYRFVSLEDQRGSLYLVSLSSGGTACAAEYVWLHTDGDAARITEKFGNCSDLADVRSDSETVTVVLPAFEAADGFVAFVYDGKTITEVVLGQDAAGIGTDADAWIGRYPFELFRDADWRAPLVALMGEDAYVLAGTVIATSTPMEVQNGWVAGSGFSNRLPGDAFGAVAINRADGRVLVAIRTEEGGLQMWGDMQGSAPDAILRVIERR